MKKVSKIYLVFLMLSGQYLFAECFEKYIWYNFDKRLNNITISTELIRGCKSIKEFRNNTKYYESIGKYSMYDRAYGNNRKITKIETIDNNLIKTKIEIAYPQDSGMGGAIPIGRLSLYFNKKIVFQDLLISNFHYDGDTYASKVVIYPEDKSVLTYNRKNNVIDSDLDIKWLK